jgi:hypothetical protein
MAQRTCKSQQLVETQTPDALVKTHASLELSIQTSMANPTINADSQSVNTGNLLPPWTNLIGRFNIPESEWSNPSEREGKVHHFLQRRQSGHPSSTARSAKRLWNVGMYIMLWDQGIAN